VKSIRRQLILTLVVCLAVLFAGASAALYVYARGALLGQFDGALGVKVRSFAGMAEVDVKDGETLFELEFADYALPEFQPSPDAEYFQVWRRDGTVLARSASLDGRDLRRVAAGHDGTLRLENVDLPDGRHGRAAALRFTPALEPGREIPGFDARAPENSLCMLLARSREDLDHALTTLLAGFAVMGGVLALGLVLTVRWSVGRGLRPLEGIAGEAAAIESTSLSHRFPEESLPVELIPITRRLNELLGRIEAAFERERRFSADVAHELRTPLAELRTLAEVALRAKPAPGSGGLARTYFRDVLDIARQMESVVAALLSLVRCEAERQEATLEPVDLPALVRKAADPFREEAQERNVSLELELPGSATARSDRKERPHSPVVDPDEPLLQRGQSHGRGRGDPLSRRRGGRTLPAQSAEHQ